MRVEFEELLMPAVINLLDSNKDTIICDYYEGLFADIENHELNHHNVTSDIQPTQSLLKRAETTSLLEIGTGTGRLVPHIIQNLSHFYAIDKSQRSLEIAKQHINSLTNADEILGKTTFQKLDILREKPEMPSVDTILVSSLSINLYLEEELDRLLEVATTLLPKGGHLILGCFTQQGVDSFLKFNGKLGNGVQIDTISGPLFEAGINQGMVFTFSKFFPETQRFVQNWLLNYVDDECNMNTAVSAQMEKIWCLDTLKPYFDSWHFKLNCSHPFNIVGGGADGMAANMHIFTKY